MADLEADPQMLAVSPRSLSEHLEVLKQDYLPLPLTGLHDYLGGGPRRPRPVALTFDDGYADNFHGGLPLLRAFQIPATIFVVAGYVGQSQEFWWDELERILLRQPGLPERLELTVQSKDLVWHFPAAVGQGDDAWHVLSNQPRSPRQTAYLQLHGALRPLPPQERERVIGLLRSWAGLDASGRPTNRPLSENEVAALAKDGLVEVGAHTMTHPVLSAQPIDIQREEISESKRRLEEIVDTPVRCFSYPFGSVRDYTSATVKLVKESGHAFACSSSSRRVFRNTDRYQIPRFLVRDWSGQEFERRLDAFFHA